MGVEWYRDLAIAIVAFTATAVFILIGVVLLLLYLKAAKVLELLTQAAADVGAITSIIREIVTPLCKVAGVINGIQKGIHSVLHFVKGEHG